MSKPFLFESQPAPSISCRSDEVIAVTLQRAAGLSGLSIATLRRHASAGRLRLLRVGGRTLVEAASLRRMILGSTDGGSANLGGGGK